MDERAKRERDNERAAIGERIAAMRESGMTLRKAAEREGLNNDAARVCVNEYRRAVRSR